jgi:tRNA(fMet)-specific endonuclease VapC
MLLHEFFLSIKPRSIVQQDMLIAAHARSEDMILVTNNVREFERVPDLVVENWVE